MPDYPSNAQPTLVINPVIRTAGNFPARDGGSGYIAYTLGQVHFLATNYTQSNAGVAQTDGGLLPIASNTALFSLLGTQYGGNGVTTFALPDMADMTVAGLDAFHFVGDTNGTDLVSLTQQNLPPASGGSQSPGDNAQPTLTMGWYINVYGTYPAPDSGGGGPMMMGAINLFAGNFEPNNTMLADGRLLQIAEFDTLFTLIGTTYGGDGQTTFALPDLRGRSPVGVGSSFLGNFTLGETLGNENFTLTLSNMPLTMGGSGVAVDNRAPGLVLTPLIAIQGLFGSFDESTPTLGEITWFAGNFAPRGFAIAAGQHLAINTNQALFSLLGTTFGGNGVTTFALPDLRGRVMAGDGGSHSLGEAYGSNFFTVTEAAIPALNLSGGVGDDTLYGGGSDDFLDGGDGDDMLYGNAGNDVLDGGTGADTMTGGVGNDVYYVDSADVVTELSGEGTDEVRTTRAGYVLADNVENLTGLLATGQNLIGNALANAITGGAGNDKLDGQGGADTLKGGLGNDTYYVDNVGDTVFEAGGAGTDEVRTTLASYQLTVNVENLVGTGTGGQTLIGNGGDNTITGGGAGDVINGSGGNDTMIGGNGNDIYYVGQTGDVVVEQAGQGNDLVRTTIDFTLPDNVERLRIISTTGVEATGNGLDNQMVGNAGADIMWGMGGVDRLDGVDGNDEMHGGDGDDYLYGGTGDDDLFGDAGNDFLRGQDGNDTLHGGAGIDSLTGGTGNDTLHGDGETDNLQGQAGSDVLWGGAGTDYLTGGTEADTFAFADGDTSADASLADRILDFSQAQGDRLDLSAMDANTLAGGDQAFSFIGTSAFAGTGAASAGELRYTFVGAYTFVQGDTDGNGTADFMIRLDGNIPFSGVDVIL